MEKRELPETTPLPGVLKILGEGCNLAAEKWQLMLIPLLLDLFLLFGPKLRIDAYFRPLFENAWQQMQSGSGSLPQLESGLDVMLGLLASVNLFGFVQIYPIGVSVLFSSAGAQTPLGPAAEIQINSLLKMLPIIGLMLLLGLILGPLYYALVARAASGNAAKPEGSVFVKQLLNVLLMYILLGVVLVILMIPLSCLLTVVLLIVPVLYQIILLLLIAFACWLMIPVFYTPHGIFMEGLDLPGALKESFRMASWCIPLTVRFILFSVVITLGLDIVWSIPNQSSWLILISIFGHAFVSTALLAGSFILFRELKKWEKDNTAFIERRKADMQIRKLFKKEPEKHD